MCFPRYGTVFRNADFTSLPPVKCSARYGSLRRTPFHPRSSYGISKVAGFYLTSNYREAYNVKACSGILYNHESPRRGLEFVTRKISSTAAKIKLGHTNELRLGNIDAKRDWGHARDYVYAMWQMLQTEDPDDYVIATGEQHTVREFAELAFAYLDLDYRDYLVLDPKFQRPADVETLLGNPAKAVEKLGWSYRRTFRQLVEEMVQHDFARLQSSEPL